MIKKIIILIILLTLSAVSFGIYYYIDQKVTDGKSQIYSGELKIKDGETRIKEGRLKLQAGKKKMAVGQSKLSQGKKTYRKVKTIPIDHIGRVIPQVNPLLNVAKHKIAQGAKQIADGERKVAEGKKKIADGEMRLHAGEKQLADGKIKLAKGKEKIAHAIFIRNIFATSGYIFILLFLIFSCYFIVKNKKTK